MCSDRAVEASWLRGRVHPAILLDRINICSNVSPWHVILSSFLVSKNIVI